MEYGLWNLPTGFWQPSNHAGIPVDAIGRPTYYAPTNTLPVFHTSFNVTDAGIADVPQLTLAGSQSYRHQNEFLGNRPASLILSRPISDMTLISPERIDDDDELICGNGSHGLANDPADNSLPSEFIEERLKGKVKMETPLDVDDASEPSQEYVHQQSFQHPMYGLVMSQISGKPSDVDVIKLDKKEGTELPYEDISSPLQQCENSNSASANCRSPVSCDASSSAGFECCECGLVTDTRSELKKHMFLSHPDTASGQLQKSVSNLNDCPIPSCSFRASDKKNLEDHVANHVNDSMGPNGKKSCSSALQRVRYEREEYRCQLCTYSCTIEKAFLKHLKIHAIGNEAPIKISCVICGKDRGSEMDMNKHMKKHRDDKFFCCDICVFKTVQLKKLIQHRRMHTGEKPHLCPHCSYRSARRDNLRSHVRRVHKKDNLFCDTFTPRGMLITPSSTSSSVPSPKSPVPVASQPDIKQQ